MKNGSDVDFVRSSWQDVEEIEELADTPPGAPVQTPSIGWWVGAGVVILACLGTYALILF